MGVSEWHLGFRAKGREAAGAEDGKTEGDEAGESEPLQAVDRQGRGRSSSAFGAETAGTEGPPARAGARRPGPRDREEDDNRAESEAGAAA